MLDQKYGAGQSKLGPKLRPEFVPGAAQLREQAGAGEDADIGNIRQPLLSPVALLNQSWIQGRDLQLVGNGDHALAFFFRGRTASSLHPSPGKTGPVRGPRSSRRRRSQCEQSECKEWNGQARRHRIPVHWLPLARMPGIGLAGPEEKASLVVAQLVDEFGPHRQ